MLSSSNYSVMCSCYWVFVPPLLANSNVWNTKQHYVSVCVDATSEDYVRRQCGAVLFCSFFFPGSFFPIAGVGAYQKKTSHGHPTFFHSLPRLGFASTVFGSSCVFTRFVCCVFAYVSKLSTNELASIIVLILFIPYLLSVLLGSFLFRFSLFRASYHDDLFYCVAWPGLEPFRPSPLTTYIHILHTYTYIRSALPTFTQHTTTYQDTRRRITEQHQHPQDQRDHRGGAHPSVFCVSGVNPQTRSYRWRCSICENWKDFGSWVTVVIFDDLRK